MITETTQKELETIYNIFKLNNIKVNIEAVKNTAFYKKIYIDIENLKSINKINLIIKTLEKVIDKKINYDFESNILVLNIHVQNKNILYFHDFINNNNIESLNNDIIFLGVDRNTNKPLFKKLSDTKSILIGGTSGSGKSSLLHQIIISYLLLNKINYIILIDPKYTELHYYTPKTLKNRILSPTAYNYADIIKNLKIFENLIFSRLAKMQKENRRFSNDPPALLVVDEFAQLFTNNKEKKKIIDIISRCAAVGRAANCYLILSTQHPTNSNLNNSIRVNLQTRICLKCENIQQSKNIIETTEGTRLAFPGESLIKFDSEIKIKESQQTFICDSEIMDILKS